MPNRLGPMPGDLSTFEWYLSIDPCWVPREAVPQAPVQKQSALVQGSPILIMEGCLPVSSVNCMGVNLT